MSKRQVWWCQHTELYLWKAVLIPSYILEWLTDCVVRSRVSPRKDSIGPEGGNGSLSMTEPCKHTSPIDWLRLPTSPPAPHVSVALHTYHSSLGIML